MLVLSRHVDEQIVIGDDIVLTVTAIRGDRVRLGISAPRAVGVHRREVYERIKQKELGDAVHTSSPDGESEAGSNQHVSGDSGTDGGVSGPPTEESAPVRSGGHNVA